MMRRARISVRPNVRPVGRGPSSSQDGQSMLASAVHSLVAGETSQTTEMVSNVTCNETAPEVSVKKLPEASGFTSTHDPLPEKDLCNLGEIGQSCEASGGCTPADTSLKRRESESGVCNIAQPSVTPRHLAAKASESSVSKAVPMASCSVAPVSVPEHPTGTEDESLKSPGQQKLSVQGKRYRKAGKVGLACTGVCVPSPEDLALSLRKESESQPSTSTVVHKASSMSSYQERIVKSRMLKKLMKEEVKKERKRYKPHLEYINPLDRSKMTMRDLIYYIPENNPMKSYMTDEQTGKEDPRLPSNEIIEKPQKEVEEQEDYCDGDLSENDDQFIVPKVKVAEDGSLILDEDSLTVNVSRTTGSTIVEENDPLFERGSTTTYSSFRKIRYVKPWSIKETDMFFLAISMAGTDFSIISQLFPHRPRKEIKNKFNREEKINPWRIDKAFHEKRPYDQQFFSMLLERILAAEKKKRNVKIQAKKVNTREPKTKKGEKKTKKEVRENARQDESHVIEEEELDCRVAEGNMEMTGKENEDSINFLKVGNKTLPNKKTGKRRNTEEVTDTSSAKPVGRKKRKMKTSVEVINCDEVVDAPTPTEEPESSMEHSESGDRSSGATTLSPSSRWCYKNPAANIGKRVTKRIPGSPENRETCCTEDGSGINSDCVSTVENEVANLNREKVKKADQIITPEEDFAEELEDVDCQLNRSGWLSHEGLFNSSSSIPYRPGEASTLTSITAKTSCQEKEYGAINSSDGIKMDTVHDESDIKYAQDVSPEKSETDSVGPNLTQDEMASTRDSSDGKTSPKKAQSGSLGRRRFQQPKPNLSRVSKGLSVIPAKSSEGMKDVKDATEEHHEDLNAVRSVENRPGEASSLTSITAKMSCQEKEYGAINSPDGIKMDTVHDESDIKYAQDVPPEKSEKDSIGPNWTQDEMSRGTDIMHPSLERRNQIPNLVQIQQSCVVQSSDVSPTNVTNAAANVSLCPVFEGRDDLENSFTNNQKEKPFDNQNVEHEEACTRDSSDGKTSPKKAQSGSLGRKRFQQPKPNLSRVSKGLSVIPAKSSEGMKDVKDATEEHHEDLNAARSVENKSGCLSREDLFNESSSIPYRPGEASTLTSITAKTSCQEKEYGAINSSDGIKMDTVHDESDIKYAQDVSPEKSETDSVGPNLTQDEMASTRDSSDGKTSPKKAQSGSLGRRRFQQPKPNLSRVSKGLSVIPAKSSEGMKDVKDATEEHHEDLNAVRSVENRLGEASSLTSITAKTSCQEKEYGAINSPDGIKMDTVHDESDIKYAQDVPPEKSEKDSIGPNWTQDEMSRGTDIMHPSLERRNQIPNLVQIQQSCVVQSSDVSPTNVTNAAANVSLRPVFEGRDDLENSFTNNQKEKPFDNQNVEHEEACTRDSSDGKTSPKKAQSGSLGRRRFQQPKPNLSRVSKGLSVIPAKSSEGMKDVKDATEEHHEDLNAARSVENRACRPLRRPSIREKIPEAVMKEDMQPVQAISSTVMAGVVTRLPPKVDSCGDITTVAMVAEALLPLGAPVTTDVTEQEPTFILTLFPVNEVPPPSESTEQQSVLLFPVSQRDSRQNSTTEGDFGTDQVLNTSSLSVTKDTKDCSEYHFDTPHLTRTYNQLSNQSVLYTVRETQSWKRQRRVSASSISSCITLSHSQSQSCKSFAELHVPIDTHLEGAASNKAPSTKCKKSSAATNKRGAKQNSKTNLHKSTKKDQATFKEEPEQLDVLPPSPETVQPISVKNTTEEAVSLSAEVEMSQDTVYLLDLSLKNKNAETAKDSPAFRSEERVFKSTPPVTPLFLNALELQKNDDDTKTERKMTLDPPIASHSSASEINTTYFPNSPTKVYTKISPPAQREFLCTGVKDLHEEPTDISEYFFSDIFTEVKESESD